MFNETTQNQLERIERLHSEITRRRPMITHTGDSHQIPSQNKTKSKLQILKNFWSCLIRCINMKWIQQEL